MAVILPVILLVLPPHSTETEVRASHTDAKSSCKVFMNREWVSPFQWTLHCPEPSSTGSQQAGALPRKHLLRELPGPRKAAPSD